MTNKLDLGDYNIEKDEVTGVLTCTPIVKKPPVLRLAKAPKHTPIQVRDISTVDWVTTTFGDYNKKKVYKWIDGRDEPWGHARLIPGYRYAWDPAWILFMEDDLVVRVYFSDGTWKEGCVGVFHWGYKGVKIIVAFEVIEK